VPAILPGLKDPLPGAEIEAAVGYGHHHGCAWRPMPPSCVRRQPVRPGQASSRVRLCNRPPGRPGRSACGGLGAACCTPLPATPRNHDVARSRRR
jgi:hypothetical protein